VRAWCVWQEEGINTNGGEGREVVVRESLDEGGNRGDRENVGVRPGGVGSPRAGRRFVLSRRVDACAIFLKYIYFSTIFSNIYSGSKILQKYLPLW
jgi:hypothetical protein